MNPPIERLAARVVETPGPLDTPCWITNYATNRGGYARMSVAGKAVHCHVVAYEEIIGKVPAGLVLDHLCRITKCCNPAHLEPVTHRENVLRGMSPNAIAWRTNTCKRGHSLADAYVRGDGRRCRPCNIEYHRQRRAR